MYVKKFAIVKHFAGEEVDIVPFWDTLFFHGSHHKQFLHLDCIEDPTVNPVIHLPCKTSASLTGPSNINVMCQFI